MVLVIERGVKPIASPPKIYVILSPGRSLST